MKACVSARVLVALQFSPEGEVLELLPVQSMLFNTRGNDKLLANAIAQFEAATVEAVKQWRAEVKAGPGAPPTAEDLSAYTTVEDVSTPQVFGQRHRIPAEPVGEWRMVARGPKRPVSWLSGTGASPVGVADVNSGETLPLAGAPKFRSPVAGSAL